MGNEKHIVKSNFFLAGNALFTVKSLITGDRFTYRIKNTKERSMMWFVHLLTGPNNYRDYQYMGIIKRDLSFSLTKGSKMTDNALSVIVFKWFWPLRNNLPNTCQVYHEGQCGRCGKRLTVPESIKTGFGPECIKKVT